MDPIRNPFSPVRALRLPNLPAATTCASPLRIALERARIGRPAKSAAGWLGLRGVGKTVLLDRIRMGCRGGRNPRSVSRRPRGVRCLPCLHCSCVRPAAPEPDRGREGTTPSAVCALAGFVGKLKVTFGDIEVGIDYEPGAGPG